MALGLRLRGLQPLQDLILVYVAMVLNHHRLVRIHHLNAPLNLMDLFTATEQIGAFQVRVIRDLARVLFSELHQPAFWSRWGGWVIDQGLQWQRQGGPPGVCLTPGLLPLKTSGDWPGWRERVLIQAMAMEAALALVATLPVATLELESLEALLGLRDALVGDGSVVDPRGFESLDLGWPILPRATAGVQLTRGAMREEGVLRRLPHLRLRVCPYAPYGVQAVRVFSTWVWALTRGFGPQVGLMGLAMVLAYLRHPQGATDLEGAGVMPGADRRGLDRLARWLPRLAQSQVTLEIWELGDRLVNSHLAPLWRVDTCTMQRTRYGMPLDEVAMDQALMDEAAMDLIDVRLRFAVGDWLDRVIALQGDWTGALLDEFALRADRALQLMAFPLPARLLLFFLDQWVSGADLTWAGEELLDLLELGDRWPRQRSRQRYDWEQAVALLRDAGWRVIAPQGMAGRVSVQWTGLPLRPSTGGTEPMRVRGRFDEISRGALARAMAARGMSQARLARTLNLDRSTISRWINGSRSIHARYRPLLWQVLGADLRS